MLFRTMMSFGFPQSAGALTTSFWLADPAGAPGNFPEPNRLAAIDDMNDPEAKQ
jgi:hypothetical protein